MRNQDPKRALCWISNCWGLWLTILWSTANNHLSFIRYRGFTPPGEIKFCPAFAGPLCSLYNQSIQTGTMPQDWKDANITPLFKKGLRSLANNYRPISLTSQVVEIIEKIIASHIHDLLSKNKFISCDQHGFRESASCVTQLLECKWLDQKVIIPMALAHPLLPINSRSRNKRRNLWVGWCVSSWWP